MSNSQNTQSAPETGEAERSHTDEGFEALLRPIQDVLTKNWKIRLTRYLENYLCHIKFHEDPSTNFSEAALVVQNSTHFYGKRVDLLFGFMQRLMIVIEAREKETLQQEIEVITNLAEGATKKKRQPKLSSNEVLSIRQFFDTDHHIDMDLERRPKSSKERKTVVLSTSMKVATKESSFKILNTKGAEIGHKSEFRLHWRMHSDGMLREDFCSSGVSKKLIHCRTDNDVENFENSSFEQIDMVMGSNDDCNDGDMEPLAEEPENETDDEDDDRDGGGLPILDEPTTATNLRNSQLPSIVNTKNSKNKKKKKNDVWATLSENLKVNLLKLKKMRTFSLPKSLLETKKRTRETQKEAPKEVPSYLFHYELVGAVEPIPHMEFALRVEQQNKDKLLRRRHIENFLRAAKEYDRDLEGFYSDNEDDDFRGFDNVVAGNLENDGCNNDEPSSGGICDDDDHHADGNDEDGDVPEVDIGLVDRLGTGVLPHDLNYHNREDNSQINSYESDALLTMQKYKLGKHESAKRVTEIAQRVQAWHESLLPVLMAAEQRTKFDIHEYGTSILEKFNESDDEDCHPVKSFAEITEGQSQKEICRYFLSSLMLANTYNLEIIKTDERDLAVDCMNLKLLSRTRHHEEMDDNLRATTKDCGQ